MSQGVKDGGPKCKGQCSKSALSLLSLCGHPSLDHCGVVKATLVLCADLPCSPGVPHFVLPCSTSFSIFWEPTLTLLALLSALCLCPLQHCLIGDDFLHTEHLCTVGFCSVLLTLWHHLPSKVLLMGFHWARLYYSPGSTLGVFKNKQNLFRQATHEHWHLQQNWGSHTVWYFVEQKCLCLIGSKVGKWLIAWNGPLIALVYFFKRPYKALFSLPFFKSGIIILLQKCNRFTWLEFCSLWEQGNVMVHDGDLGVRLPTGFL